MIVPALFPPTLFRAGFETRTDRFTESTPWKTFAVHQVHSARVVTVDEKDTPEKMAAIAADALVTSHPQIILSVRTADCVPVLLAHPEVRCVGAIHAGWRGLVGGIILATVEKMFSAYKAEPKTTLAAVGPAIGNCCYEVDATVASALAEAVGDPSVVMKRNGKLFADLHAVARLQLLRCGIPPQRMEFWGLCTRCNENLFYSNRRGDGKRRQNAFIGIL